ncbi:MAG: hypothetical protein ACFCUX_01630 [Candidatus Methylacidiphilales bacterium]
MPRTLLKTLLMPGWIAFRTYWKGIVLLQGLAALYAWGYFTAEPIRRISEALSLWKEEAGIPFVIISTVISGALIPELLKLKLRPAGLAAPTWGDFFHVVLLYALFGVMVDFLYTFQDVVFGPSDHWRIVVYKILFDQYVYTLLVAAPLAVSWFAWRRHSYRVFDVVRLWSLTWYVQTVLPIVVSGSFFWIPVLACVYSLPAPLRFPLFLFANSAWALLLIFMARRGPDVHQQRTMT